jgi:hypothetical protein
MEKLTCTKGCLFGVSVIMTITRVPLVKLLCQAAMGWIPTLVYLLPGVCGPCDHVLSYQAVNVTASCDLDSW